MARQGDSRRCDGEDGRAHEGPAHGPGEEPHAVRRQADDLRRLRPGGLARCRLTAAGAGDQRIRRTHKCLLLSASLSAVAQPARPVQSGVASEGLKVYYEVRGAGESIVLIADGLMDTGPTLCAGARSGCWRMLSFPS